MTKRFPLFKSSKDKKSSQQRKPAISPGKTLCQPIQRVFLKSKHPVEILESVIRSLEIRKYSSYDDFKCRNLAEAARNLTDGRFNVMAETTRRHY